MNCTTKVKTRRFPRGSDGQDSAWVKADPGSIPELARSPGEGNGNPLHPSRLEDPHGQRSLEDYRPWSCKEWDTTESTNTLEG